MKTAEQTESMNDNPRSVPLAIIGMGCMFPLANDVETFWNNIKDGVDAISEIPESHWRASDYYDQDPKAADKVYAKMGGFLSPVEFNPMEYGILPNAIEAIDTSQLLGLLAVEQALKDAGYSSDKTFDRDRVSVILGVTGTLELVIPLGARLGFPQWKEALDDAGVDPDLAEDIIRRISDSYVPWQENSFPGLLGNVVAGRISKHFDFGGTNCVVDAACGSSLSALNLAALELATGRADMVVTGGIDTFNDIFMYTCFSKTPALSPSGHARPYAEDSDGTTLGEGLGIVVLKRLADAERDGDRIYAVVKGIGSSSDGRGAAIYEPDAAGQTKALRRAYEQGGVAPETVELIEGHGTGTRVGDAIEVSALHDVFGQAEKPWCALGSIKSQIGHTKAAAGSAGLIKAALALYHKTLPATIKVDKPQPSLLAENTPFYVNTQSRPWFSEGKHPRRAGISALGFGGSNFHCLLEEYQSEKKQTDWKGDVQIVPFSAADNAGLAERLQAFNPGGDWNSLRGLAAELRREFDPEADCRLVLVAEKGGADPDAQRRNALTMLSKNETGELWETPDGVYYARGDFNGATALLFPGQGAQYPGMLGDLAMQFPAFHDALLKADQAFSEQTGGTQGRLSDMIHPRPKFDETARTADIAALQATEIAQPALGAVSLGAARVLEQFGVKAVAAAGHSFGELTALSVAGVLAEEDLHRLSRLRGELMAAGEGDRGTMLAVSAPLERIETFLRDNKLDLVLANRNTPTQGVLSGSTEEIGKALELLNKEGLSAKQLSVSAAFHSKLVAGAAEPFARALEPIPFHSADFAVYSNTTAGPYPPEADQARALLAGQLAQPVDFVSEIENLYEEGARLFIEAGPGARLTGMVKAILGDRPHVALALDASNGKRSGISDLARLLARVSTLGQPLDLTLWDATYVAPVQRSTGKKALTVNLCGANSFKKPGKRPPLPKKAAPVAPVAAKPINPPEPSRQQAASRQTGPAQSVGDLQETLRFTQQSMQALQSLQEQTARLHQQFLEGQQAATRSFMQLIEQQQALYRGGSKPASTMELPETPLPAAPQPVFQKATVEQSPEPAPPETAPAVATTDTGQADRRQVAGTLLEVIAEKTGYPQEMLELEMALDSDLGIDSIKRVEILSALQERLPELPAVKPEDLGVLQTLGQIVEHLCQAGTQQRIPTVPAAPATGQADRRQVAGTLLEVIAEKTGYPQEMLELEMALDSDLGIDSIKRVEILSALQERLPELPAVKPEDLGVLQTLGQIVEHLCQAGTQQRIPTVPAAPATGQVDRRQVAGTLLEVIAEKTGYPQEMLELEMALDSDLGIDSIKRVEILSALQERLPELPAVKPEDLGVLQTLGQIVEHLCQAGTQQRIPTVPAAPATGQVDRRQVAGTLLEVIAEKTGYPQEMLELEMALDSDLGIDSIKRVEILSALQERLPGAPAIKPEHLGTLQTVQQIVDFLASVSGGDSQTREKADLKPSAAARTVRRQLLKAVPLPKKRPEKQFSFTPGMEVWISDDGSALTDELCSQLTARQLIPRKVKLSAVDSLAVPETLGGLLIVAPLKGTNDRYLRESFQLLQKAEPALHAAASRGGAFLATVSRLDGRFGLDSDKALNDPLSGGLAGLCKTAALEWPEIHCKALDLAMGMEIRPTAEAVVNEIFVQSPLEVGITSRGLQALELEDLPLEPGPSAFPLAAGDLVVVSGGARGVTAECAVALATASRATLLLLGRSDLPGEEPEWLAGLKDEAAIKKAVIDNSNEPLKPRDVATEYQRVMAEREIRTTLERILKAGGKALYRSVDLRDDQAVADAVAAASKEYGPVRGLIHGAGVLADKLLREKTPEQFDLVYLTKVEGLRHLLSAVEQDDLRFMAMFSSSTGRFGRIGQADYAVANEALNKIAAQQAVLHPDCRVVSLNWGPWDGGMVTPALKNVFEQEGIAVIDLQAGAEYLVRELALPAPGPVELVLSGGDAESVAVAEPQPHQNIYVSKAFDLELCIDQYPFLRSHVIDGKAVLPAAVIVEWLAHGALHNNPGLKFQGLNDLRVLKGVILQPDDVYTLQVMTGKAIKSDGVHLVPVELSGITADGRQVAHARARVLLATTMPEPRSAAAQPQLPAYPHDSSQIYQVERLFHGKDFHGISDVVGCSSNGISARVAAAPKPGQWIQQPLRSSWFADPLILDSSFQLLILWSFEEYQAGSLPVFVERYRQYHDKFPETGVEIHVKLTDKNSTKANANIEFVDPLSGDLIARMENYECVIDASLNETFQRNKLSGVA